MVTALAITEGEAASGTDLGALAAALGDSRRHTLATEPGPGRPVLTVERVGTWRAGPYAGVLATGHHVLELQPRGGWDALAGWVEAATGLSAEGLTADTPVTALAALVWARAVDGASRHGPPAFRQDVQHTGSGVRGRVDVRRTVRLRAKGSSEAASVFRARELDNPVTRVIVAADRVFGRRVGGARWHTDRVAQILPQLYSAVGRRATVPGDAALARMRYTPITRPFKWAAELSARVVRQDPVLTTPQPGRPQGLLLDTETIARAAILRWARDARPDLRGDLEAGTIVLQGPEGRHAEVVPEDLGRAIRVTRDGRTERFPLSPDSDEARAQVLAGLA